MGRSTASKRKQTDEIEDLRSAAADIARELRHLGDRLAHLTQAVEAISPAARASGGSPSDGLSSDGSDGLSSDGASPDGAPHHGATRDGASRGGASRDGVSVDGDAPAAALPAPGTRPVRSRQNSRRVVYEEFRVSVRPLPELAMAAVAETSLRSIPGVNKVKSVERVEDSASFLLEVSTEIDLITEMRAVMPVGFRVTDSQPNEISLELKWLWGADST
jgi:hypothetical protein